MNSLVWGRRLSLLLSTVAIVFAACTSSGSIASPGASNTAAGPSGAPASASGSGSGAGKSYRIALVLPTISINILNDIYTGAKDKAAELGGVEIIETGQLDSTAWLNDCMQVVAAKVDVLVYDSIDGVGNSPCIQEANKNGIKVVCVVACVTDGKNDATVTLDAKKDGQMMGEWTAKTIGSGEVGFLEGASGDAFGVAIGTGYKDAIAACGTCQMVADVPGGLDRNSAYTTGLQVMTSHPNLKGIAGSNDDVGLGLVQAAQQQGKVGQIAISGHGGSCNGLSAILKGDMSFTVVFPGHLTGATAIQTAMDVLQGKTVQDTQYIPALGLDTATAKSILDGTTPNPTDIDVLSQLKTAQSGCPSS